MATKYTIAILAALIVASSDAKRVWDPVPTTLFDEERLVTTDGMTKNRFNVDFGEYTSKLIDENTEQKAQKQKKPSKDLLTSAIRRLATPIKTRIRSQKQNKQQIRQAASLEEEQFVTSPFDWAEPQPLDFDDEESNDSFDESPAPPSRFAVKTFKAHQLDHLRRIIDKNSVPSLASKQ